MPIQKVLLLAAAWPMQLDPDTDADFVFVSDSLGRVFLPGEVLDVVESKLQLVGRMDVALPTDVNQMPPLVGLLPALLLVLEKRVSKQRELELKVLVELCFVASLSLGQLPR